MTDNENPQVPQAPTDQSLKDSNDTLAGANQLADEGEKYTLPSDAQADEYYRNTLKIDQDAVDHPKGLSNDQLDDANDLAKEAPVQETKEESKPGDSVVPESIPHDVANNAPLSPGQVPDNTKHPDVQKANLLRDIAWGLSGGQRYDYSVGTDGQMVKTERPVSSGRLALAAALGVLSTGLTGASFNQARPGEQAEFYNKQDQQKQATDEMAKSRAQQEFQNQETIKVRQAQNAEVNSRTMLNVAQAQKLGVDAIQTQIAMSAPLLAEQKANNNIADGGEHITEEQFREGQRTGKFNMLDQQGGVDGSITQNGKTVPTFTIVHDPNAPAKMTQDDWDQLSQYFPTTFKPGVKVGENTTVSFAQKNKYMQEIGAVKNMEAEVGQIQDSLKNSESSYDQSLAANMKPLSDALKNPESNPQLMEALMHGQRYISGHDAGNIYEQLKTMKEPTQASAMTPQQITQARSQFNQAVKAGDTRSFQDWMTDNGLGLKANPDAKYADTIADAFGGWEALGKIHEKTPELRQVSQDINQYGLKVAPEGKTGTGQYPTFKDFINQGGDKPDFEKAADAFTKHEGVNPKYNNPGALADVDAVRQQPGYIGSWKTPDGKNTFARFDTPENGRKALIHQLQLDYQRPQYSDLPLDQFIGKKYSPTDAPGNKPGDNIIYANDLLKTTGMGVPSAPKGADGLSLSDKFTTDEKDFIRNNGGLDSFVEGTPGQPSKIQAYATQHPGKVDNNLLGSVISKLNQAAPDGSGINKYRDTQVSDRTAANSAAIAAGKARAVQQSGRDENGNWNTHSAPVQLVMGNLTPDQLPKRSDQLMNVFSAADEYAQEQYGVPYDARKAQTDMTYAKNKNTQDTLKYLNSLTGHDGKGGNIAQLVSASNQISRTEYPPINDILAWQRLKTGSGPQAAYNATVAEVADQIAKVLQGGGGSATSDAKLKQASELFSKGFTGQQIIETAAALAPLLQNRKTEMIGNNQFLLKDYGKPLPKGFIRAEFPDGVIRDVPSDKWADARDNVKGLKLVQIGQ